MDPHSASPCFRVTAAGTGKTESPTVTGANVTNVCGGEARSRREIAGQLARAANESSFTRVPLPPSRRRGARSPGPSFSLGGLIAISLGEIAPTGNQDTQQPDTLPRIRP